MPEPHGWYVYSKMPLRDGSGQVFLNCVLAVLRATLVLQTSSGSGIISNVNPPGCSVFYLSPRSTAIESPLSHLFSTLFRSYATLF